MTRPSSPEQIETTPFIGVARLEKPLLLDCGVTLFDVDIAYCTYGELNHNKDNAVLICHAVTGDQFVASPNPITGRSGWWPMMVGPKKTIDSEHDFIISSNILGGCMGSTGPSSKNPQTQKPYGQDFPIITIADMVRAQEQLVTRLGIEKLFCVIGGSMGGMQALEWARLFPERLSACVLLATTARHSAQNIAFHEVGRQAIMADPDWREGDYLAYGVKPEKGLAVARMAAHITYLSEAALQRKFGRNLQHNDLSFGFDADFQVESYLRYQGSSFVDRFDANSYLYLTRAMDYFDMSAVDGSLAHALSQARDVRFCVLSFSSDWLYPTAESRFIVRALNNIGARTSFVEIESDKGHDAFLLDEPVMRKILKGFLAAR